MTDGLESFKHTKTILLTTYKRDGTPIATPVSVAFDGDRAFFRSYDKAWKTRRLRNNPGVGVAPATLRGKPTGPDVHAQATLLSDDQAQIAARCASCATVTAAGSGSPAHGSSALPHHALRAARADDS